ncbi:VOC family protein [Lactobacillus sp. 3B(2020)]|uniref:VOC family protein n=1 Tax=Lactobacillus sp. 3B(2020) TaxID=2695882 RepID=UPI0015DFD8DA|nr:VOC family protein [Lactobacillus sp. 3B(2020)]QLL69088.1 VOC family protein [Lactobacillus sp. 3B(2020)]
MAFNKSLAGYYDDLAHVGIPTDDLPKTEKFWAGLGFKEIGRFDTDDQGHEVIFMQAGHLTLEIWNSDGAVHKTGAINHISLNVTDADGAYQAAKKAGYQLKEDEVQHLDYWQHGIKYFNIVGPNDETIEFCEIVKA